MAFVVERSATIAGCVRQEKRPAGLFAGHGEDQGRPIDGRVSPESKRTGNDEMPELPEVEVIRRALVPWVVGRTIVEARIVEPRLTRRRGTPEEVAAAVVGRRVRALRRRGSSFFSILVRTASSCVWG